MSERTDHARTLEYLLDGSPGLRPHEIAAMKAGITALDEQGEDDD